VRFSRKRQDGFAPNFFQGLRENTCLLQRALKNNVPAFKLQTFYESVFRKSRILNCSFYTLCLPSQNLAEALYMQ